MANNKTESPEPEEFVRVWQAASSVEEVAERLGISASTARNRASYYRKRGVELKQFPSGRPSLDVDHLQKVAEESLS